MTIEIIKNKNPGIKIWVC